MIYYYGNAGGIQLPKTRDLNSNSGYAYSIKDLFEQIIKNSLDAYANKKIEDFKVRYYGFDDRLDRDVYMVLTDYGGYKDQYVRYFIYD